MSCCGVVGAETGLNLAEVLRSCLDAVSPRLPSHHWKVLRALLACRTPALGGHRYLCAQCGRTHFVPHACRNRHCPLCQGGAARQWLEQQQAALLPVPYFHLVFTLPHDLNPLIQQNQRALYTLFFNAASQTLLSFGQNRFAAQLGVTAILHTWSQTLLDHYHLHCIVTGGGLSTDGSRWIRSSPDYLFPVAALSKVFQGKFCAGLQQLYAEGKLQFHGQLSPWLAPQNFGALLRQANRQKWCIYAKRPFAGPEQVLAYLSRYTHRVALSPRRLLALDRQNRTITFAWKDYADSQKQKRMTLGLAEFIRRFCLHLLPERFVKIRHYGFLSNRLRQTKVAQARALLSPQNQTEASATCLDPKPSESAKLAAPSGRVCPYCGSHQLRLVEVVRPQVGPLRPRLDSS